MKRKQLRIKCPNCGAEYMPGEIYLPKYFLGQPELVIKNERGEIVDDYGIEPDTAEEYICDYCDKKLKINTSFNFNVRVVD